MCVVCDHYNFSISVLIAFFLIFSCLYSPEGNDFLSKNFFSRQSGMDPSISKFRLSITNPTILRWFCCCSYCFFVFVVVVVLLLFQKAKQLLRNPMLGVII